jgi:hypothetical protein
VDGVLREVGGHAVGIAGVEGLVVGPDVVETGAHPCQAIRADAAGQPSSNTSSGRAAETSALGASTTSEIRRSAATLIRT